jgi:uncharacterized protein (UPF0548 family)
MALVSSDPKAETVGTAAKVVWITLAAIALGVLVALADKLLLGDDIEDAVWQTLLAFSPVALLAGRLAPASVQRSKTTDSGTPARV